SGERVAGLPPAAKGAIFGIAYLPTSTDPGAAHQWSMKATQGLRGPWGRAGSSLGGDGLRFAFSTPQRSALSGDEHFHAEPDLARAFSFFLQFVVVGTAEPVQPAEIFDGEGHGIGRWRARHDASALLLFGAVISSDFDRLLATDRRVEPYEPVGIDVKLWIGGHGRLRIGACRALYIERTVPTPTAIY